MKLTQKQWNWLIKAPEIIQCGNGNYYRFIQSWDDNGDPIIEVIKGGNPYLKEIISPNRNLNDYFRNELHYVWEVWRQQQLEVIHLTTDDILPKYNALHIDSIKISHTKLGRDKVMKANKIILHHKGKTKILKNKI